MGALLTFLVPWFVGIVLAYLTKGLIDSHQFGTAACCALVSLGAFIVSGSLRIVKAIK